MSACAETNVQLYESIQEIDSVWQMQQILHLGCMITDDYEHCDALESLVEDLDEDIAKLVGFPFAQVIEHVEEDEELLHEFVGHCARNNHFGFLVKVHFPKVERSSAAGASIRWGLCRVKWFYADSLQEVIQKADAFGKSIQL